MLLLPLGLFRVVADDTLDRADTPRCAFQLSQSAKTMLSEKLSHFQRATRSAGRPIPEHQPSVDPSIVPLERNNVPDPTLRRWCIPRSSWDQMDMAVPDRLSCHHPTVHPYVESLN
jgi:hypothetical protein